MQCLFLLLAPCFLHVHCQYIWPPPYQYQALPGTSTTKRSSFAVTLTTTTVATEATTSAVKPSTSNAYGGSYGFGGYMPLAGYVPAEKTSNTLQSTTSPLPNTTTQQTTTAATTGSSTGHVETSSQSLIPPPSLLGYEPPPQSPLAGGSYGKIKPHIPQKPSSSQQYYGKPFPGVKPTYENSYGAGYIFDKPSSQRQTNEHSDLSLDVHEQKESNLLDGYETKHSYGPPPPPPPPPLPTEVPTYVTTTTTTSTSVPQTFDQTTAPATLPPVKSVASPASYLFPSMIGYGSLKKLPGQPVRGGPYGYGFPPAPRTLSSAVVTTVITLPATTVTTTAAASTTFASTEPTTVPPTKSAEGCIGAPTTTQNSNGGCTGKPVPSVITPEPKKGCTGQPPVQFTTVASDSISIAGSVSTTTVEHSKVTPCSGKKQPEDGTDSAPPGSCTDVSEQCAEWVRDGECDLNPYWMKLNCQKSCNTCGISLKDIDKLEPKPECKNEHELCQFWKLHGECEENKEYMDAHCKLSCDKC